MKYNWHVDCWWRRCSLLFFRSYCHFSQLAYCMPNMNFGKTMRKKIKKIAWIQSHHIHLYWKFKLWAGKVRDVVNKHLNTKSLLTMQAMFSLYASSKLSCLRFKFLLKVKVIRSNPGYLSKSFLLYEKYEKHKYCPLCHHSAYVAMGHYFSFLVHLMRAWHDSWFSELISNHGHAGWQSGRWACCWLGWPSNVRGHLPKIRG